MIPIKVALRLRPLNNIDSAKECIEPICEIKKVVFRKEKHFSFDYVFEKTSSQIEIYNTAVQPLLEHVFKGYNATVFAYGQTGSGKTHTMGSNHFSCSSSMASTGVHDPGMVKTLTDQPDFDDIGIIPRVFNEIFKSLNEMGVAKSEVCVSFVEIYNEEIRDLLSKKSAELLDIREENGKISVSNLTEVNFNFNLIMLLI
jgi:kinesin family protein 4/21/27